MVKTTLILVSMLLPLLSYSQTRQVSKFLETGIGPTAYKGDLSNHYQKFSSSFHLGLLMKNDKRMNGHFDLMIGNITGQNANLTFPIDTTTATPTPNKFFRTSLFSVNYDLIIKLIKKKNFTLYISQGIGILRFKPVDENKNNLSDQFNTREENETYNNFTIMLPTNIGAIYTLKNNYGLGVQLGWLNSQSDYLDNISKWGTRTKKDNVFICKFSFYVPLTFVSSNPKSEKK
jgi:hypothetical protein